MSARWMSHLVCALVPFAAIACGDDTVEGTGGAGGGGGATTTTATTSGPTTATSTASTGGEGGSGGEGGFAEGGAGGAGGEGGTTGEGGGLGGGVPDLGTDACPGDDPAIEIVLDGPLQVFEQTTAGRADDLDTCLGEDPDDDGGDWIFQFTLPAAASLRITLEDGEGLDGNLVVRPDCAVDDEFCFSHSVGTNIKEYALHTEPDTFSVIIDSVGAAEGEFNLGIVATTPECGDGILNPGEECDPGGPIPIAGCIDPGLEGECTFEPAEPEQDLCPGEPIDVPEGSTVLLAGDGYTTNGFEDDYSGTCELAEGGVDRVFAFNPAVTGTLTVLLGADETGASICGEDFSDPRCWDGMLYARSDCEGGPELDCSNDLVNEIAIPVVANVPVFVFVDGYDGEFYSRGSFDLQLELMGL